MTRLALPFALAALLVCAPAASAQLPAGSFVSDNVEYVGNFATSTDSSGARLVDGYFYITTERDLRIYDVKVPEAPVEVGSLMWDSPGTPVFTEEDPDTNGKVLIRWDDGLEVIDVTDKTAPKVLGNTGTGDDQHTVSCVLDCTYAYGSEGAIVDLRDPAAPKVVGNWQDQLEVGSTHDVTEVSPGIVVTSTEPLAVLDARQDPVHPTVLARTEMPGFTHANLWPNGGTDRFALVGGEKSAAPDCSDDGSATFQTFDTTGWQTKKSFTLAGQFKMSTGVPTDGSSPYTTWCVHWFDEHPTFNNGGLVAIAWYEHGVRFLKVATDGKIEEIGYFLPFMGQVSGVYWITDQVLYTADYYRGMDVLKFTGEVPQGTPKTPATTPPPAMTPPSTTAPPSSALSFDQFVAMPKAGKCVRKLRIRARKTSDRVTKLTVRANGKRKSASGKRLKRGITIRAPRRKRFTVQVQVRTKSGHTTAGQRTYKGC